MNKKTPEEIGEAYIDGITRIANAPRIKAKGHTIKKWMVVRVLVASKLLIDGLEDGYLSACHRAFVKLGGAGDTHYYICTECNEPCNPYEVEKHG